MSAAFQDTSKRHRGRPRFTCDQCNQHKKKCIVLEGMSSCVRCDRIGHGNCSFASTPSQQLSLEQTVTPSFDTMKNLTQSRDSMSVCSMESRFSGISSVSRAETGSSGWDGASVIFHSSSSDSASTNHSTERDDKVDDPMLDSVQSEEQDSQSAFTLSDEEDSVSPTANVNSTVLLVYPFDLSEDKAIEVSSNFKELGGHRFGLPFDNRIFDDGPLPSYGSSRTNTWEIKSPDYSRLLPGRWLNDSIVGFFLSW